MLFKLNYINTKSIEQIYEVLKYFLKNTVHATKFEDSLFPAWFVPVIKDSTVLRNKFKAVFQCVKSQTDDIKHKTYRLFINNNKIQKACKSTAYDFKGSSLVPSNIYNSLKNLCLYLWDNVFDLACFKKAVTDKTLYDHYAQFIEQNNLRVCPFCGLYPLASPGEGYREDYDHHFPKSKYPLSSVNFENLVPMCSRCNQSVKKQKDVIFDDSHRRRISYYPYADISGVDIVINCKRTKDINIDSQTWSIKIAPRKTVDTAMIKSWQDILEIEPRYLSRIKDHTNNWEKRLLDDIDNCKNIDSLKSFIDKRIKKIHKDTYLRNDPNTHLEIAYLEYLKDRADNTLLQSLLDIKNTDYSQCQSLRGSGLMN